MPDPTHAVNVGRLRTEDLDPWRALWAGYLSLYRADVPNDVTELTFKRLSDGSRECSA